MKNDKKLTYNRKPILSLAAVICIWALLLGMVPPAMATEDPAAEELLSEAGETAESSNAIAAESQATQTENTVSEDAVETAGDTSPQTTDEPTDESSVESGGEDLLTELRDEIAAYIERYQISPEMPDSALADAYITLDSDGAKAAWDTANVLLSQAEGLSTEEADALLAEKNTKLCLRFYDVMERINMPSLTAEHNPLTGIGVTVSGADSDSMTDSKITVKVTATSNGGCGGGYTAKTATITISNNSASTATIAFDWTATSINKLEIDETTYSGSSGSFSKLLGAGENFTITITTAQNSMTNTLAMSNFSLTAAAAESNVTFEYSGGSITVDGSAPAAATVSIPVTGAALVATPSSGYAFLGWIDGNGSILSTSGSYILKPASDMTVRAVFASTSSTATAWFMAGGTHMFNNLNTAADFAEDANTKTVILMNNATLPAGDYTIPRGVTLLIPFDAANTLYTTKPAYTEGYERPSPYRTLTLAEGANIIIQGAMSISGKHCSAYGNENVGGTPSHKLGWIEMENNSTITVENGAALYAWGYITGSGSVAVQSGGSVYEAFQITDYHGGSNTSDMAWSGKGVFPIAQYYIQNIEVQMTLYSGAAEYGYTTVYANGHHSSTIDFIGGNNSGAMIQLLSGYATKKYDGTTDRLLIEIYGNVDLSSISLPLSNFGMTIDSKSYVLPLNGNMTITFSEGTTTAKQDIALLPGIQINILEEATLKIASGYSVYAYDLDDWDAYCGFDISYSKFIPALYAPGRTYNRTEADLTDAIILVNGTLDATEGSLYTTSGGATVYSSGSGVAKIKAGAKTSTYQYRPKPGEGTGEYIAIPITSAKLTHGDGTQLQSETNDYYYGHDVWYAGKHQVTSSVTLPTCAEQGYTTHTCPCGYETKDTYTETTSHTWSNGICSACGALSSFSAANVQMENSLNMQFAYSKDYLDSTEGFYVQIVRKNANTGAETTIEVPSAQWTSNGNYYIVSYNDLAAKCMCDTLTLTVYNAAGEAVSEPWGDSMRDYALRVLKKATEDTQKTLVVDFLNYGAEAQIHFTYAAKDLANNQLTDEQKSYASVGKEFTQGLDGGDKRVGSNLILESNILFVVAFRGLSTDMYATVEFEDHYGNAVSTKVTGSEFGKSGSYYYIPIDEVVVADARQPITITVYNADQSVYTTCQDSIEDYLARYDGSISDINTAVMKFADSAYAYLHRNDNA